MLTGQSPCGGTFEKVEKARVGTELCRVEVTGEACMHRSKFGATVATGSGKSVCIGGLPHKLPCMEVRKFLAMALLRAAEMSLSHSSLRFHVSVETSALYCLDMKHA